MTQAEEYEELVLESAEKVKGWLWDNPEAPLPNTMFGLRLRYALEVLVEFAEYGGLK